MHEEGIVGLSLALVDGQTIIWQKGFGYEDKEKGINASENTIYRAGSITKTINAMAVMKLAEEQKMDIDKPLKIYLPEFSIKSRFGSINKITPRNIMTHHSGIPGNWLDKMYTKKPIPYTNYVQLIKDEYTAYPPNTILSYSNLAITLLGHAVEKTANIPYSKFIKTYFLNPLEMNSSSIKSKLQNEETSKSYANAKEVKDEYQISKLPAGALNTSVSDLANLAIMINNNGIFNNKTILKRNTLNEILKVQNKNIVLDLDIKTGLGLFINDKIFNGLDRIYSHEGATVNHRAYFASTEKSKLAVIVMSNTENANVHSIAIEMLKQARNIKIGKNIPLQKQVQTKLKKSLNLEGTYASQIGKIDIIKKDKDTYLTEITDTLIQLKKRNDNKYYAKYMLFDLIPINHQSIKNLSIYTKNIQGKTIIVADNFGEKNLFAVKIKPKTISQTWKNRLGTYEIINQLEIKSMQIAKIIFKIEDKFPILEINGIKYILEIINDNEAIIEGIGRSMRETIRIKNGIVHYQGLQFKLKT